MDKKIRVVLSKLKDAASSLSQQIPVYRYEGFVRVSMVPKAFLIPDPTVFPNGNMENYLEWVIRSFRDLGMVASRALKKVIIGGLRACGMVASGALNEIIIR
jgi:hypothetical protein